MINRIRKAMDEKDQGFTLIELLVVIIIIGILAAIAIPVFLNQRKKGVDAGLKSDLKNAATSVETWNTDNPSTTVPSAVAVGSGVSTPTATAGGTGNPLTDFKASPGDVVKLTGTGVGTYTIGAYNAGATAATSATACLVYSSQNGGLVTSPATAAC